jgi:hypothetical protein
MIDVRCPDCGVSDELTGAATDEGIRVTCHHCGRNWLRDALAICAGCGGHDLIERPQAMTQFSRGNQLSLVGWRMVPLCRDCDAQALQRSLAAGGPIPPGYQPVSRSGPDTGSTPGQEPR